MALDDFIRPTLRARLRTAAQLLDREADWLNGYGQEKERGAMMDLIQAGWREVLNIRARAAVQAILEERNRRPAG